MQAINKHGAINREIDFVMIFIGSDFRVDYLRRLKRSVSNNSLYLTKVTNTRRLMARPLSDRLLALGFRSP